MSLRELLYVSFPLLNLAGCCSGKGHDTSSERTYTSILCIVLLSNHLLVQYRIISESMTVYQDIVYESMIFLSYNNVLQYIIFWLLFVHIYIYNICMSYVSCTRKIMAFFFRYTRCLWGQCHIEEWVSWHWTMAVYAVYSMNLWRPSSRGILGKGNSPTKPTGSGRKFGFQTILFFGGGKVLAVHSQDIFHKKALVERILYCRSYDLPLWSLGT